MEKYCQQASPSGAHHQSQLLDPSHCSSDPSALFTMQPHLIRVSYFIVLPLLAITGVAGNLLTAGLYLSEIYRGLKRPVVKYCIIAKMIWDSLALLSAPFVFTLTLVYPDSFYPRLWLSFGVVHICRTAGIWISTAISIERLLAVLRPYLHHKLYNRQRVRWVVALVSVSSVLYCLPRFAEFVPHKCNCTWTLRPRPYRMSPAYQLIYIFVFHCLLLFALPFSLIVIFNALIFSAVRRFSHHHGTRLGTSTATAVAAAEAASHNNHLHPEDHHQHPADHRLAAAARTPTTPQHAATTPSTQHRQASTFTTAAARAAANWRPASLRLRLQLPRGQRDGSITLMLLVEAAAFIGCNSVSLLLNAIESAAPRHFDNPVMAVYLPVIGNVLTFTSCANNFPIFYLFGSVFRRKIRNMLGLGVL